MRCIRRPCGQLGKPDTVIFRAFATSDHDAPYRHAVRRASPSTRARVVRESRHGEPTAEKHPGLPVCCARSPSAMAARRRETRGLRAGTASCLHSVHRSCSERRDSVDASTASVRARWRRLFSTVIGPLIHLPGFAFSSRPAGSVAAATRQTAKGRGLQHSARGGRPGFRPKAVNTRKDAQYPVWPKRAAERVSLL